MCKMQRRVYGYQGGAGSHKLLRAADEKEVSKKEYILWLIS
jgi:hypothetical protein